MPLGTFSAPTPIPSLSTIMEERNPTMTADRRELYFVAGGNIWVSLRADAATPWPAPVAVDALNTGADETDPEVSADGLELYFVRTDHIYVSTRADRAAMWSGGTAVAELSSTTVEYAPALSSAGLTIVFASGRPPAPSGTYLWTSTRSERGAVWTTPVLVSGVEAPIDAVTPALAQDSTRLAFVRDVGSQLDMYETTRPAGSVDFAVARPMDELNAPGARDAGPWLSEDGHYIVFDSERVGGSLNADLYEATR